MANNKLFLISALLLTLSGCAPFDFNNPRAGVCNQLNSQMIFSGGTSNTRNADIGWAEQPLIQKNYDSACYTKPVKKKYS